MIQKDEFKEFDVVIKILHFILHQSTVFKMHGIHCGAKILFIKIWICISPLLWLSCKLPKNISQY